MHVLYCIVGFLHDSPQGVSLDHGHIPTDLKGAGLPQQNKCMYEHELKGDKQPNFTRVEGNSKAHLPLEELCTQLRAFTKLLTSLSVANHPMFK